MALGVEAAGFVAAAGSLVTGLAAGDRVIVHSAPLRDQGSWAEWFVAPAEHCAALPPEVPFDVGAALPVPGLTAGQVIDIARPGGARLHREDVSRRGRHYAQSGMIEHAALAGVVFPEM